MSRPKPIYIGNVDMTKVSFGPREDANGKTKVDVYLSADQTKNNKFNRIAFCKDALEPLTTRFALDTVREDKTNLLRRGLGITISDEVTVKALQELDETLIRAAVTNSKDWFKGKILTEEQVRLRYKPVLAKLYETDETLGIKVKVKCPGSAVPTALHLRAEDGTHYRDGGRIDHLTRGAKVAPIMSASYGIWFMGGGTQFGISFQIEEMIIVPGVGMEDDLSQFASSVPLKMAPVDKNARKRQLDDGEPSVATGEEEDPVVKVAKVELLGGDDGEGPM